MSENLSQPVSGPTAVEKQAAAERFALAKRLLGTGHVADAILLIRECCRLDPANIGFRKALRSAEQAALKDGASGWLGTAALRTKFKMARLGRAHVLALEHGEALLARAPTDIGCQLDMAESAMALGLTVVALWILETARQQEPNNDAVNLASSKAYEQAGLFRQSIALLAKVGPRHPQYADIQRKVKDLMAKETIHRGYEEKTGEAGPTTGDTAEMHRADPTTPQTPALPGLSDRLTREVTALRARIAADPTNVNNYMPLVALLRNASQLEQARDVLREGLAATSQHAELVQALGDLNIEPKRQNLAALETKIKSNPADAALRGARNALLQDINQDELKMYRQKVKAQPSEAGPRYELAVRLFRAKQYQEAVKELQVCRDAPRFQWQSLAYLGMSFEKLGIWQLAQRNLQDALQKLPAEEHDWRKRLLFHLAQGAAAAGDLDEAKARGYELANLDFTYRGIDQLLAQWSKSTTDGHAPDVAGNSREDCESLPSYPENEP
jgi:tetratricopeptide (TPR) repeat protein